MVRSKLPFSLKAILLTALVISASSTIKSDSSNCWDEKICDTVTGVLGSKVILIPTLFGFFRLCAKEPVVDFQSRFALEKLKGHMQALKNAIASGNINEMLYSIKILAKDGWYFLDDEVYGQFSVSKTVEVKGNNLYVSEEKDPHGVLGTAYAYLTVLGEAKNALISVAAIYLFLRGDFNKFLHGEKGFSFGKTFAKPASTK